jgi:serine O-acetyltransferase
MNRTYTLSDVLRDWGADIGAYVTHGLIPRTGWRARAQRLSAALMPNVVCCLSHRLAHWMYGHGWPVPAVALAGLVQSCGGASINPASRLGGGLYLPHPSAVVIQAEAGPGLRVYAGGHVRCRPGRILDGRPLFGTPRLGAGVVIGARAVVSGPVQIGDEATVSFGAAVDVDVPAGATAMRLPLRNYRVASPLQKPGP